MYLDGLGPIKQKLELIELNPGSCDGLDEIDIKKKYSEEYVKYQSDPFRYRLPRAESYADLAVRLENSILGQYILPFY